jgi:hypothetical protein
MYQPYTATATSALETQNQNNIEYLYAQVNSLSNTVKQLQAIQTSYATQVMQANTPPK